MHHSMTFSTTSLSLVVFPPFLLEDDDPLCPRLFHHTRFHSHQLLTASQPNTVTKQDAGRRKHHKLTAAAVVQLKWNVSSRPAKPVTKSQWMRWRSMLEGHRECLALFTRILAPGSVCSLLTTITSSSVTLCCDPPTGMPCELVIRQRHGQTDRQQGVIYPVIAMHPLATRFQLLHKKWYNCVSKFLPSFPNDGFVRYFFHFKNVN